MSELLKQLKKQAIKNAMKSGGPSGVATMLSSIGAVATGLSATATSVAAAQQPNTIQPLRLGDFDTNNNNQVRYDGQTSQAQANQTYTEVETLQTNLRTIGLDDITGTADGDYGSRTAIAVAIFQGFALVKTRDDNANNVANPINFTGQVTGNADAATRTVLRRYVNENIDLPVQALETRLDAAGFGSLIGTPDDDYTWGTYFAVREFQSFSKMANVAQEPQALANNQPLGDQYQQIANTRQYTGPVNGVMDVTVDENLTHWQSNRWRCPLIMEAWNMSNGNRNSLHSENFWYHDEMTAGGPRVFARDLSGYYTLPAARQNDTRVVVGGYTAYPGWGGPSSQARYNHTWSPEAEFLPESCTGNAWNAMNAAEQSTFRTIRAICERESMGYLDCMNAYDRAVVSAGPYHWTICLLDHTNNNKPGPGELMALMAMLRSNHQAVYEEYFEYYGVRPNNTWGTNGATQFDSAAHKYADWIKLQISDTDFVSAPRVQVVGDYFRIWPWFYRVQMMCRLSDDVKEEMWIYARMRVRDVSETEWGNNATVSNGQGGTRPAKIGDYYTSERALAMITRWHVWMPAHMVRSGNAGPRLTAAFARANLAGDPSTWTTQNEQALIDGLQAEAADYVANTDPNSNIEDDLNAIDGWPGTMPNNWNLTLTAATVGTFQDTRNSLDLDTTDLPTIAF